MQPPQTSTLEELAGLVGLMPRDISIAVFRSGFSHSLIIKSLHKVMMFVMSIVAFSAMAFGQCNPA